MSEPDTEQDTEAKPDEPEPVTLDVHTFGGGDVTKDDTPNES